MALKLRIVTKLAISAGLGILVLVGIVVNDQIAEKGTGQRVTSITDVNRGAGETGIASSKMLSSAQSLSTESGHLRSEVEKFLSTVRAA